VLSIDRNNRSEERIFLHFPEIFDAKIDFCVHLHIYRYIVLSSELSDKLRVYDAREPWFEWVNLCQRHWRSCCPNM